MKLMYGDMWSAFEDADLFLITTNSFLRRNGELVMGAGIAKQARDRFPGLAKALGRELIHLGRVDGVYGMLVSPRWPERKLGAFQVKVDWRHRARLDLIQNSTDDLDCWVAEHPTARVHLNFPGIGFGGLDPADVLPILEPLPDNVFIWQFNGGR